MAEHVQVGCSLTRVDVRVDRFSFAGCLISVWHLYIFFPEIGILLSLTMLSLQGSAFLCCNLDL